MTIRYPNAILLTDGRGVLAAKVHASLDGHLRLVISAQQAKRFGWAPPAAPAPFGRWSRYWGQCGMVATFGLGEYRAALEALGEVAAPKAQWSTVQ